jgi:hypothetical protein
MAVKKLLNQQRLPLETMRPRTNPPGGAPERVSPEGRYLAGPGKPVYRHVTDLQSQEADAAVKVKERRAAVELAEDADRERKENHRGGDRTWLLRLLILIAILAEAVTAYVAMEALVASQELATALAMLAALIGAGMACTLANRRLNRLPVPSPARILEGIFVAVLTVLRYESLQIQGAGSPAAFGAAALAALISALALIGIEEIVTETHTFAIFASTLRASWDRRRLAAATTYLDRIQARILAALDQLQQHFLDFLLKTEELPLDRARQRAAALKAALSNGKS